MEKLSGKSQPSQHKVKSVASSLPSYWEALPPARSKEETWRVPPWTSSWKGTAVQETLQTLQFHPTFLSCDSFIKLFENVIHIFNFPCLPPHLYHLPVLNQLLHGCPKKKKLKSRKPSKRRSNLASLLPPRPYFYLFPTLFSSDFSRPTKRCLGKSPGRRCQGKGAGRNRRHRSGPHWQIPRPQTLSEDKLILKIRFETKSTIWKTKISPC